MQVAMVGEALVLSENGLTVSTGTVVVYHRCRESDVTAYAERVNLERQRQRDQREARVRNREVWAAAAMTRAKERKAQWEAVLDRECPKCLAVPEQRCVNLARRAKGLSDEPTKWPHTERFITKDP